MFESMIFSWDMDMGSALFLRLSECNFMLDLQTIWLQLGTPISLPSHGPKKAHGKSLGKVARMRAEDLQKQLEQARGRFNGTTDRNSSRII